MGIVVSVVQKKQVEWSGLGGLMGGVDGESVIRTSAIVRSECVGAVCRCEGDENLAKYPEKESNRQRREDETGDPRK